MNLAIQLDDFPADRKARGAFFTPPALAEFITKWAIRSPLDNIFEPSCGEAAFLLPAAKRLQSLGAPARLPHQLSGVDIFNESIERARQILGAEGIVPDLAVKDFFECPQPPAEKLFDAVIGNPPYIRYQNFSGVSRARAIEAALRQGVRLSGLASSWAAFVIHASAFLKPEGRLGLIIPAELLSVNYASDIRRFLLNRFGTVRLVMFEERVFPGVLEEVVLLLAEGTGGANKFELFQAKNISDLNYIASDSWVNYIPLKNEKWTSALLPADAFALYNNLLERPTIEPFSNWATAYLGAVTGNNNYFAINAKIIKEFNLNNCDYISIIPPGSRHLRGLSYTKVLKDKLISEDQRCFLFYPSIVPSTEAIAYIKSGEEKGVNLAYKCKVRTPWWRVPLIDKPDLIFTYMNHNQPQIVNNDANANILNSIYGLRLKKGRIGLGKKVLNLAFLNSLTLLGSEINGRSYGGGLLKHEPREVDKIPLPSFDLISSLEEELLDARAEISVLMRHTNSTQATEIIDRIILKKGLSMSDEQITVLRKARLYLINRRISRGKSTNVTN